MKGNSWKEVYENKTFELKTTVPSVVVQKVEDMLKDKSNVLDLGCGSGRNSIHLAREGHRVHAIDIADLGWSDQVPKSVRENILFKICALVNYNFPENTDLIIAARLIMYIPLVEVKYLIEESFKSLKSGGYLVITYSVSGGIFSQEQIAVEKYSHSPEIIKSLIEENGFNILSFERGLKTSKYNNYEAPIESYDIVVQKS